jgi:hypothetical protein
LQFAGGPVQGHLVGVATFINSGIIDLQSNPVAGDVLVITGARQAGLVPTPLIVGPGPGTFISNGGVLKLDMVLNEGGAATRSDTLVVDGTLVGGGRNKHGDPQRRRRGSAHSRRRDLDGAGTEPGPLRVRRVFTPGRLYHRGRVRLLAV